LVVVETYRNRIDNIYFKSVSSTTQMTTNEIQRFSDLSLE